MMVGVTAPDAASAPDPAVERGAGNGQPGGADFVVEGTTGLADRLLLASARCRAAAPSTTPGATTGYEGATVAVIVGQPFPGPGPGIDGLGRWIDPPVVAAALDHAGAAGVTHVVLVSSAMVYGAWADNPVPIPEERSLRPLPDNALAVRAGEAERLVDEWRRAEPGRTASVLRPCLVVDERAPGWLPRTPWGGRVPAVAEPEPPIQVLELADLVQAVLLAADQRVDDVLNVAPDGWLRAEQVRDLAGPAPRFQLPEVVAQAAQRRRWFGAPLVPFAGILPYVQHPWVVANDRLRALGWEPGSSNEEAFVAATPAGAFAGMSAERRQLASLGGAGAAVVLAGVGVVALVRRLRR